MKTRSPVCPECSFEVEINTLTGEWWCEACGERGEVELTEEDQDYCEADLDDDWGDRD